MLLSDANMASQHTPIRLKRIEEMKKKKAFSRGAVGLTRWLKNIYSNLAEKSSIRGLKNCI